MRTYLTAGMLTETCFVGWKILPLLLIALYTRSLVASSLFDCAYIVLDYRRNAVSPLQKFLESRIGLFMVRTKLYLLPKGSNGALWLIS